MKKVLVLFSLLFVWSSAVQAGGYMIGEMSSRSTGMASAFTAVSDDASAAWHNPAGIAFTDDGNQIMLGGAAIMIPGVDYTPNAFSAPGSTATSSNSKAFFVPHAYFTHWNEGSRLGATISVNAPFGLETDWPATSSIALSNTFSRISMVNINPSVVFKVSDHLSVSGGFSYAYLMNVDLNSLAQKLEGKGKDGWGGTASIMYKNDTFSFGVMYRSQIKLDINGGLITGGSALPAPFVGLTTTGNTSLTLPDMVNTGIAWKPNESWLLSLDVDWVNWKTFNEIRIVYAPSTISTVLTGGTNVNVIQENWKDTVAFRAGAEWKYNSEMRARFGYIFDPTPIKDVDFSPSIPGNDRHIFSVGYGYDLNPQTTLDLAYAYVWFKERNQTVSANTLRNGTYKSDVHIVMASLSYRF